MLQLGIFTVYFPYTFAEAIHRIKGRGFTTVHPDPAIRKANLERLKKTLARARDFGTPYLTCGFFTSSG
jgi:hypothetical protein